jgi:sec-independent protein translocase protein TatC
MRITFLSGFVIALPYICFEILRFLAPGISRKSRLIGLFGIPFVGVFFVAGLIFAYKFMLDPALEILLNFMEIQTIPRPNSYFRFVTSLMFWIGIAFEFPLVAFVLSSMGIITSKTLRDHWRLAFIILAILAAMITPTIDPINMMIVLLPLWSLYGLSILMASIGGRKLREPLPE